MKTLRISDGTLLVDPIAHCTAREIEVVVGTEVDPLTGDDVEVKKKSTAPCWTGVARAQGSAPWKETDLAAFRAVLCPDCKKAVAKADEAAAREVEKKASERAALEAAARVEAEALKKKRADAQAMARSIGPVMETFAALASAPSPERVVMVEPINVDFDVLAEGRNS